MNYAQKLKIAMSIKANKLHHISHFMRIKKTKHFFLGLLMLIEFNSKMISNFSLKIGHRQRKGIEKKSAARC